MSKLTIALAAAFLALCGSASAQEEIIGGGVYLPAGAMITPLMSVYNLPTSGTTDQFGAVNGPSGVSGLGGNNGNRSVPIPTAGTIQGVYANLVNAQNTGTTKVVSDIVRTTTTGTDGNVTCTFPTTVAPTNCNDNNPAHFDTVNAGDSLSWHFSSGGWNQPTGTTGPQQLGAEFVPTDGKTGILLGGPEINPTLATGTVDQYVGFGAGGSAGSLTEATVAIAMPEAGTIQSFYFSPNTNTNTNPQTAALCINSTSCTAAPVGGMQCTLTASSSVGCCVAVVTTGTHVPKGPATCGSTTAISFNKGDTISVHIYCPNAGTTACTSLVPGYSISYLPATPGQSILVAQWSGTLGSASPLYGNLIDTGASTGTQTTYGLTPWLFGKTITFGNTLFCSSVGLTGANQVRQIDAQEASTPGTAPTTIGGTTVSIVSSNPGPASGACPGGNSALLVAGNTGSFTWTAGSGYSVDTKYSAANITTGTALYKTSMTATIK